MRSAPFLCKYRNVLIRGTSETGQKIPQFLFPKHTVRKNYSKKLHLH